MTSRIDALRAGLAKHDRPGLLVSDMANVRWASGFSGSFGFVVVTPEHALFLTDSRYEIQAQEEVKGLEVRAMRAPQKVNDFIVDSIKSTGVASIGFEASISFGQWQSWSESLDGITLLPTPDLFKDLRIIKSPEEIALIRKACGIVDYTCEHITRMVQVGVTEMDIALDLEFTMRRQGAEVGFPSIVVAGPNSARPHGHPGERKLERGDFVTMDFGARVDGYHSDITRTFVVGEASERHREIYELLLKAQVACIEALKPGANGRDVDGLARKILDEKGLAKYFGHGLGHGLGLAVHDYGRLSSNEDQPIMEGQIWTVEPGVYIEGFGGARIEDDVLVTSDGPEVLTRFRKELTILG